LVTAVIAMFTRENAVTLPLMIVLYEFTFFKGKRGLDWKPIIPFLLTIFIIPLTVLSLKSQTFQDLHGNLKVDGSIISPINYFVTQIRALFTYIRLAFLPINQNLDYDYPILKNVFELSVLISFLSFITILYWVKRLFLKYRLLSFSILWFFLTLTIPESSFWAMGNVIFEHRLYLPLAGFSIFLVSSVYYLWGKNSLKLMVLALIMILTCYSALTYQRNTVWRDEVSLWEDVVQKSPHKARPYNNRGNAYIRQDNFTQAMLDFNKAIEINPNYADAYSNRGASYLRQGNLIQALSDYNKSIEIDHAFIRAYLGRATAFYDLKEYDKAWGDVHKIEEIGTSMDQERINNLVKALSSAPKGP
jgi:tetratricopeptide (TPR) repeat protein